MGSNYLVQSSTLKMAENIGCSIGFENVIVEHSLSSGDADIKFIDEDVYHLQIKSPLFFKSKYERNFTDISKEFDQLLSKSRSRFVVGYATRSTLWPIHIEDIKKSGWKASLGILAYDTSFVPTRDIIRKVEDVLYDANRQLRKIREKSWKIFILDITHYPPRGNLDFYNLLFNIFWPKRDVFDAIDGIGLFSWNIGQTYEYTVPSTIIPVILKNEITSKVFRQPFQLYQGIMLTIPTNMQLNKGWNDWFEIDKGGYIGVDEVEYGPFWAYVNLLSTINEQIIRFRLSRFLQTR